MSNKPSARWWLAINGKSEGPFSSEEIGSRLRSGRVTASTPACAEGLTEWKPIASWPALANAVPAANSSVRPPPPPPPPAPPPFPNATPSAPSYSGASDPVLTNPLLPQMANWICVYSIGVAPVLWFVRHMLCCVDGTLAVESDSAVVFLSLRAMDAFKCLAVTVLLFIGGMRFRRLCASGAALIRIALWIGLIGGAAMIALYTMTDIAFAATAEGGEATASPPENTAAALVQVAQIVIGFCEIMFMVFSLAWLTRHQLELPLTPGT